jgi:hypothetical protein
VERDGKGEGETTGLGKGEEDVGWVCKGDGLRWRIK